MSRAAEEVRARFDVSRESFATLQVYCDLLLKWNRRINLIGRAGPDEIWERHIADGLQLIRFLKESDRIVLDLGSGAGVPGLVLALGTAGRYDLEVRLVESNGKKAAFLREAIRLTGASAKVVMDRIESHAKRSVKEEVNVLTARALAPLPELLGMATPWLEKGARGLFHKGSGLADELTDPRKYPRLTFKTHPSLVGTGGFVVEVQEISHV
ncbi:MAG: 16S rRNA (guanine(527)-N(7))-methyltransferase RsmG [Parvibaculaceae bacterium]